MFNKILKFKKEIELHPELAWTEFHTQEYIETQLGKPYWKEKTALVYKLGIGEKKIYFRAELDALNTTSGVLHVCGHSSHSAALMGAYLSLKKEPPKDKTIYFVFQPSEESFPSGAKYITERFPEIFSCHQGFAFHAYPHLEKGEIVGIDHAAGDYIEIEVFGKNIHIRNKNNRNEKDDALIQASKLLLELNGSSFFDAIINIGTFEGGETPNSIAGYAKLTGDVRSRTNKSMIEAKEFVQSVVKKYEAKLTYYTGFPTITNDKTLLDSVKKTT